MMQQTQLWDWREQAYILIASRYLNAGLQIPIDRTSKLLLCAYEVLYHRNNDQWYDRLDNRRIPSMARKIWAGLNYGWKEIRFWHEWNLCCKFDKTCPFILQKFQPILKSKAIFLNCVSLVNFLLPFILNIFDVPFNKQQTIEWLKTEWTLDFIHNFIFIVLFQQYIAFKRSLRI